jgi:hypothetical protein
MTPHNARCERSRPVRSKAPLSIKFEAFLRSPEMIVRTWRAGKRLVAGLQESEVSAALQRESTWVRMASTSGYEQKA